MTLNLENLTQNQSQAGGSQSWPPRVRKLAVCFKSNSDPLKSMMHHHPPRPAPTPTRISGKDSPWRWGKFTKLQRPSGDSTVPGHCESALSTRSRTVPNCIQLLPVWFKSSSLENAGRAGRQSHNVLEGAAPPRGQLRWTRR